MCLVFSDTGEDNKPCKQLWDPWVCFWRGIPQWCHGAALLPRLPSTVCAAPLYGPSIPDTVMQIKYIYSTPSIGNVALVTPVVQTFPSM